MFLNASGNYAAITAYLEDRGQEMDGRHARTALIGHVRGLIHYLTESLTGQNGVTPTSDHWRELDSALTAYATVIKQVSRADRTIVLASLRVLTAPREGLNAPKLRGITMTLTAD